MGLCLGLDRKTGQHKLYEPADGSLRFARTAVRLPNKEQWNVEQLQEAKFLLWQAQEYRGPEVIFTDKPPGEPIPARPDVPELGRRLYIKPADIEAFGWTRGCPRREHERTHVAGCTSKPHCELRLRRLASELMKAPEEMLDM